MEEDKENESRSRPRDGSPSCSLLLPPSRQRTQRQPFDLTLLITNLRNDSNI